MVLSNLAGSEYLPTWRVREFVGIRPMNANFAAEPRMGDTEMLYFRRCFLLLSCLTALGFESSATAAGVTLTESADDTRTFAVRTRLKVEGTIQTAGADGKTSSLKTVVDGKLSFLERRLPAGGRDADALRSIRYYELAEADITVADRKTVNRLDGSQKVIVAEGRRDGVRVYSHDASMTPDGVELLRTPGDNLILIGLLPAGEVQAGSTWKPDDWVLPALATVEAVEKSEVSCKVDKLDERYAVISFEGKVSGAIQGALTKIGIKGQLAYDLQKKNIRQVVMTQTEERSVGAVSPGMQVTATLYIDRSPSGISGPLTDNVLNAVAISPTQQQLALWFNAPWGVRFAFDRNWSVFHQKDEVAVLRLVEAGSLLAQCNVSKVPSVVAGQQTTSDQFQADIRTSLGAGLQEIVKAEQTKTEDGLILQRVVATGTSRDIPMHWLYYLCTAPDGRQLAFAFSVESRLVEKLAGRDREMVESVIFTNQRAAALPQ